MINRYILLCVPVACAALIFAGSSCMSKEIDTSKQPIGKNSRSESSSDLTKALEAANKKIILAPHNPVFYKIRAELYNKLGKFDDEVSDRKMVIHLSPNDIAAYCDIAAILIKSGPYGAADTYIQQALKLDPKNATTLEYANTLINSRIDFAQAKIALKMHAEAKDDYDKALAFGIPVNPVIYIGRASAKFGLGDKTGALKDIDTAIMLKPDDGDWYAIRSQLKVQLKDFNGAQQDYDTAQKLHADKKLIEQTISAINNPSQKLSDSNYLPHKRAQKLYIPKSIGAGLEDLPHPQEITMLTISGRKKCEANDFTGAIEDANKVIALAPDVYQGYWMRAVVYTLMQKYSEAESDSSKAIQLSPQAAPPYLTRANALIEQSKFIEAVNDISKAKEIDPEFVDQWPDLQQHAQKMAKAASDLFALGNIEKSKLYCEKSLMLDPKNTWAIYTRARCKHLEGNYADSLEDCKAVVAIDPKQFAYHMQMAMAYEKMKDFKSTITCCNRVIELEPNKYVDVYACRGSAQLELRNYSIALVDFNKAIDMGAKVPIVFVYRAICKRRLGDFDGAYKDAKAALQLSPDDVKLQQFLKAMQDLKTNFVREVGNGSQTISEHVDPKAIALADSAQAKCEKLDFSGALKDITKAIELSPDTAPFYCTRAALYVVMEKRVLAIADARKAIELNPKFVDAYGVKGIAMAKDGDLDAAYSDFLKIQEIAPASVAAKHLTEGLTELMGIRASQKASEKQWKEALEDCKKIMTLSPNDPRPYFLSAECKTELADHIGAANDNQKAQELERMKTNLKETTQQTNIHQDN